jgi:hypothetical protein
MDVAAAGLVPGAHCRWSDRQPTADALPFERTAFLAASGCPPERPGELHPRGSERTPGLHLLLAHLHDEPVGTAHLPWCMNAAC